MKKRSPNDIDLFQYEENLIQALGENNSRYLAEFGKYMIIPACPVGKQQEVFKVGDIVDTTASAVFKQGFRWEILDIYKENGYYQHVSQMILTTEQVKKKCPATKTCFRQDDIVLIQRPIQSKKSEPRKTATREGRCQFCGNVTKISSKGLAVKHQYAQHEGAFPSRCPGSGLPLTIIARNLS